MPVTISIKKQDSSRRGEVNRSIEFADGVRVINIIGALDGFLRSCYSSDMRHRTLTLSRDTTRETVAALTESVVSDAIPFDGILDNAILNPSNSRPWMGADPQSIVYQNHTYTTPERR